ncbi:hypothetical protein DFH27DRAFT_550454 [Peziza echinospora]|nr:hypothetical protein DFH27DRAFT_550454 [Peziza echinospora]
MSLKISCLLATASHAAWLSTLCLSCACVFVWHWKMICSPSSLASHRLRMCLPATRILRPLGPVGEGVSELSEGLGVPALCSPSLNSTKLHKIGCRLLRRFPS